MTRRIEPTPGPRCEHLSKLAKDKELRSLQERVAQQWRAKHADELRRFDAMMARREGVS